MSGLDGQDLDLKIHRLSSSADLKGLKAKGQLYLRRDILFAAWSGEELGLLGSSYFTRTFGGKKEEPTNLSPGIAALVSFR